MENPTLAVNNVSVTYPNGHQAIEGISFCLKAGVVCAVVGMNGAGKSTLFKTMMGFIKPTNGSVSVMGQSVRDALRRNVIAYVPQSEDVDWNFPVLVRDVVMMGRYGHMGMMRRPSAYDKQRVAEALDRVSMRHLEYRHISELSGGQKKRVFVARALAQEARIIFLDEPFTGVDTNTEDALIALFRDLASEGCLILVATHNLGSVPVFCDEVILINKTLVANGPVDTTFTHDNLFKAFGGRLRHIAVGGTHLHDDTDPRRMTVLTDDERPVVLYGADGDEKIIPSTKADS